MAHDVDLNLIRSTLRAPAGPSTHARRAAAARLERAIVDEQQPARSRTRGAVRMRTRPAALVAALAALVATGAAAAATHVLSLDALTGTHASPQRLFTANPQGGTHVHSRLISGTARLVQTLHVPGAGAVQFWTAAATHDGICLGIRRQNGQWGDLTRRSDGIGSGTAPGCVSMKSLPYYGPGFGWFEAQIGRGFDGGRLAYGVVPSAGHPTIIQDQRTRATAPVIDGRFFAIVIPPEHRGVVVERVKHRNVCRFTYHLQTLNATGRVLATAENSIEP